MEAGFHWLHTGLREAKTDSQQLQTGPRELQPGFISSCEHVRQTRCGNRKAPERSEKISAPNFLARKQVPSDQTISILSKQLWPHGHLLRPTLEFLPNVSVNKDMEGVSLSEYRLLVTLSRAVKLTDTLLFTSFSDMCSCY